jgi:hypothetical protein
MFGNPIYACNPIHSYKSKFVRKDQKETLVSFKEGSKGNLGFLYYLGNFLNLYYIKWKQLERELKYGMELPKKLLEVLLNAI